MPCFIIVEKYTILAAFQVSEYTSLVSHTGGMTGPGFFGLQNYFPGKRSKESYKIIRRTDQAGQQSHRLFLVQSNLSILMWFFKLFGAAFFRDFIRTHCNVLAE